jgi:hypothetical protein
MIVTKTAQILKRRVLKFVTTKEIEKWDIVLTLKNLSRDAVSGKYPYGETDKSGKEIFLNPFKGSFADAAKTAIHEILHGVRPHAAEKLVRRWEREIWFDMTTAERTLFINSLFAHVVWGD